MTGQPAAPGRAPKYPTARRCGQQIRRVRLARHWTTTDLALRAGLSQPQVSAIELGRVNTPIETLARIAEALEVPLSTVCVDPPSQSLPPQLPAHEPFFY